MKDFGVHAALFALASVAIVMMGAFYAEPDDALALRSFPKRWMHFALGCGLLAAVMLLVEHTLAAV